jgi:DNA sulfur modification protein DndC
MGSTEMAILRDLCGEDDLHFELTRELLSVEKRHKSMLRRAGLFEAIEDAFERGFYDNEEDAVTRARQRRDALDAAHERALDGTGVMVQEAHDLVNIDGVQ